MRCVLQARPMPTYQPALRLKDQKVHRAEGESMGKWLSLMTPIEVTQSSEGQAAPAGIQRRALATPLGDPNVNSRRRRPPAPSARALAR